MIYSSKIMTEYFSTFCIDIDIDIDLFFFGIGKITEFMIVTYFREIDRKVETVHIDQLFEQLIQIPNLTNILLKFSQSSAVETLLFTFQHFQFIGSNR